MNKSSLHTQTESEKVSEAAKHLNSKLHMQAKKFMTMFNTNPNKCMTLDLQHLTTEIDESLLNFIKHLTMPIRDGKRKIIAYQR